MAFSLDQSKMITNAVTGLVHSSVVIGLPTSQSYAPLFMLCEIPEESVRGSVRLPGALTQAGEMKTRSVIEPSEFEFQAVIAEHDSKNPDIFKVVQISLTAIASIINSMAGFGMIFPNLSNIATGYVQSQISALTQIKNNMQPVMILGSYFSLGVMQQATPYLNSWWFIESFSAPHEGGKDGTVITIKLREQFEPVDWTSAAGIAKAVAGQVVAPLAGVVLGGQF
jgi:hypothetical protein